MSHSAAWNAKKMLPLVGGVVKEVFTSDDKLSWGFNVVQKNGTLKTVWVLSDDEGNDSGSVDIC